MLKNIVVEDAWEVLRSVIVPLQPESVLLNDALGRIAAIDIAATDDLPHANQSAVDGFVIHNDNLLGNCELKIGDPLGPGKIPNSPLLPGNTVKVGTGGVLPEGTAAVIPEEKSAVQGNYLSVETKYFSGSNVRTQGEDFKLGDIIVGRHERLTPGMLGVLAAFGQETVKVYRQPSVALLCLGPEIIPHDFSPLAGQVRDSNGLLLSSLIMQEGGRITGLRYIGEKPEGSSILDKSGNIFEKADLIVTIGGAYGDFSKLAPSILREAGAEMLFWEILSKPGSHSGGGIWRSKPILALSGNAAACVVGYHLLVSPVLRKMQGLNLEPQRVMLPSIDKYKRNGKSRRFLRGQIIVDDGMLKVRILPGQKSSMMRSLLDYNSLIDLRPEHPPVQENSLVAVIPLHGSNIVEID